MSRHLLSKEERDILDAIERGQWEVVRPTQRELRRYAEIARNTLRKSKRVNIRISEADLSEIRSRAAQEGIPYQTLITSLLHKYVSGRMEAA